MHDVVSIILGGGQGKRLRPLTSERAKPAVPVGGKYRLIDIPVSNCINSNMNRIFVLTQFLSASLHKHIQQTYQFDQFSKGFVHIIAASESAQSMDWFQGTADAVRRVGKHIATLRPRQVVILAGDQICRMDLEDMLRYHSESGADATVACIPVDANEATRMGIVRTDPLGKVIDFVEKPPHPEHLKGAENEKAFLDSHGIKGSGEYLASMGVYIFESVALATILADQTKMDFGGQVLPEAMKSFTLMAYPFSGYWRDVGTIEAFYQANLELTAPNPPFSFYEQGSTIYTRARHLPLSKVRNSKLDRVMIAEGCDVRDAEIEHAVIGIRTRIGTGTVIKDSVILGTDFFETPEEIAALARQGLPPVGIGANCRIERAIIDKNARIGDGVVITDKTGRPDFEGTNHWIRDGIVVVPKGGVLRAGTKI